VRKKAVAGPSPAATFPNGSPMSYGVFTNDSLTLMHEAVRGALTADDAPVRQGKDTRFRVREMPDWKTRVADVGQEMLKPGLIFDIIGWLEDQVVLPFEERGEVHPERLMNS
jgi:hypothetical protein